MKNIQIYPFRTVAYGVLLGLVSLSTLAFAQDGSQQSAPDSGGWRRMSPAPSSQGNPSNTSAQPGPGNEPADPPPVPAQLTIKTGTYITVRVNQVLSSDRNQQGDAFSATLGKPVIVDGVVVAERGQTVGGRVVEAKKAGRVEGVSRLGIQLTDLPISDGQQVPIQSQLVSRNGPTSQGRDAGAIAATTVTGAAVGAAVNGGVGAGVGAGAGLVTGVIGVMLTRGRPTYITPETVLTFRVDAPVTIATDRAPQAFRYVNPGDYDRPADTRLQTRPRAPGYGPGYYGPGYPGYYPYYPYYWGGGFSLYYGPGFYGFRGGFRR